MQTRREFLANTLAAGAIAGCARSGHARPRDARPNVVIVMSDDQGYGDLGCHGHHLLQTPNLDRLHAESLRFTRFYTYPVCSPTRASLMTGRYAYRTGVTDTYVGRANMDPRETTLAEALQGAGYATGIFGKWHLGDSYPLRPIDRGFNTALVHKGGGLCQPSDPRVRSYYDPILWLDGEDVHVQGYCTDVFTDHAVDFIEAVQERPFFVYLAANAPHTPLDIAHRYAAPYRAMGAGEQDAKFYGMISNLDENVGRVMAAVDAAGQRENTIFIFLTDNGTAFTQDGRRYNAGMRGSKGTVFEGGVRVPFFMRWPVQWGEGRDWNAVSSVIDVMPTLLAACGVRCDAAFDGVDQLPLLRGEQAAAERTIFTQWHRGDVPVAHRNAAVITQHYKLIEGQALFDLAEDPGETRDVSAQQPEVVARLRGEYEAWFADVCATRGFAPVPMVIGSRQEPVNWLTGQDMRGVDGWGAGDLGVWPVEVARGGRFHFLFRWLEETPPGAGRCVVACDGREFEVPIEAGKHFAAIREVPLKRGPVTIAAWHEGAGKKQRPAWVEVRRTEA